MKVKIIRLSKNDSFYGERKELIGQVGEWKDYVGKRKNGWYGGDFTFESVPDRWEELPHICFAYVKFEVLEK